jgi:dihydroxyacetone kinase-like protein
LEGLTVAVSKQDVLAWLAALQRVYAENRNRLTELDSTIGDADHGSNMDRGFTAVQAELAARAPADISGIFQTAAAALIRNVGGASGPLYGTFFLRAATAAAGKAELHPADVADVFAAGIEGIKQRGKAEPGDKTMLDALLPAREALQNGGTLQSASEAAEQGMRATIPLQARKGRASYLGERSIGHQDPGATSAWLLVKTAAETWPA